MTSSQLTSFLETLKLGLSFVEDLPETLEESYEIITTRKRNGGKRVLKLPDKDLKWLQTRILRDWLIPAYTFPAYVQGGVKRRSPKTNGDFHKNSAVVINVDLRDFFGNITPAQVEQALKRLGFSKDLRVLITKLTTFEGSLPQGAPTSTFLANLVALELDEKLFEIAQKHSASYSRYVDDITFSGDPAVDVLIKEIKQCIRKSHFVLNPSKTRIQRSHRRQTVTKVIVNKRLSVPKDFLRQLRQDLHYCQKFGVYGHCEETEIESQLSFVAGLAARIGYVISIDPEKGGSFLKQFRSMKDEEENDEHYQNLVARRLAHAKAASI